MSIEQPLTPPQVNFGEEFKKRVLTREGTARQIQEFQNALAATVPQDLKPFALLWIEAKIAGNEPAEKYTQEAMMCILAGDNDGLLKTIEDNKDVDLRSLVTREIQDSLNFVPDLLNAHAGLKPSLKLELSPGGEAEASLEATSDITVVSEEDPQVETIPSLGQEEELVSNEPEFQRRDSKDISTYLKENYKSVKVLLETEEPWFKHEGIKYLHPNNLCALLVGPEWDKVSLQRMNSNLKAIIKRHFTDVPNSFNLDGTTMTGINSGRALFFSEEQVLTLLFYIHALNKNKQTSVGISVEEITKWPFIVEEGKKKSQKQ